MLSDVMGHATSTQPLQVQNSGTHRARRSIYVIYIVSLLTFPPYSVFGTDAKPWDAVLERFGVVRKQANKQTRSCKQHIDNQITHYTLYSKASPSKQPALPLFRARSEENTSDIQS